MIRKSSLQFNVLFNLTGSLLPLSVSLFVIPVYLTRVGQSRYGIISLVWLLFGYFGLFDLGLSQATANHLARVENQSATRQQEIFWTASIVNLLLGFVAAVTFDLLGNKILEHLVEVPSDLTSELRASMIWITCLLPLATTSGVFVGALEAQERFLELNVIQIIGAIVGQLAPLGAVVYFGARIDVVVEATVFSRLVSTVPLFVVAISQIGSAAFPKLRLKTVKDLFQYGGWITVSSIVNPILTSIDQFMIGAIAGVASLPKYSIPFNMTTRISLFPVAITRALFPQLTKLGPDEAIRRAEAIAITVSLSLVIICAPLLVLNHYALTLWLGAEFSAKATIISQILIFGVWINGVAYVPFAMIHSQRKPSTTAMLHVIELLPFIAVLWLGVRLFGPVGAALAWTLRVLADAIFLFRAAGFSNKIVRKLAPSLLFLLVAFGVAAFDQVGTIRLVLTALVMFASVLVYAISVNPTIARLYSQVIQFKIVG